MRVSVWRHFVINIIERAESRVQGRGVGVYGECGGWGDENVEV